MPLFRRFSPLVAAAMALSAAGEAKAAVVAYDGFESYVSGSLSGKNAGNGSVGANGEFGWTAQWNGISALTIQPGALVYNSGAISINGGSMLAQIGGTADTTDDAINAADRSFAAQTGTLYFSFLFDAGTSNLDTDDFIHFMLNNDTVNTNSGGIGDLSTGTVRLGVRSGTTNGGVTTAESSTNITASTTFLLVGKLSKVSSTTYNRMDLFINPSSFVEPVTPDATRSGDTTFASSPFFTLRTFNLDAGDAYRFDELRITTTFAEAVPEPASAGLLAAGALGLLARRPRRRTN